MSELQSLVPDTQAVLLLTASFDKSEGGARPLSLSEYNAVASWLAKENLRPAALLGHEAVLPTGDGLPDASRLRTLLGRGAQMALVVEKWQGMGLWVIRRGEAGYPERLRRVLKAQAPPLLFGAGDPKRLSLGGVAIVGSRDVPEDGLAFTRRVAGRCASDGKQVVSGGARGVDQAAAEAALEAGGGVAAVVSCDLLREATAKRNKDAIRSGRLTLACPYEPEAAFAVWRAMGRNKHVYALSDRAVVVHCKKGEGGTWAGAIERLEANGKGVATIPVFVRRTGNARAAVEELERLGGFVLSDESIAEPGWTGRAPVASDLFAVVAHAEPETVIEAPLIAPVRERETPVEPPEVVPVIVSVGEGAAPVEQVAMAVSPPMEFDGYKRCLPAMLHLIREERPAKSAAKKMLAERMKSLPTQIDAWLKRALAEGAIIEAKEKRATRYAVPERLVARVDAA